MVEEEMGHCTATGKVAAFNAGPYQSYWWNDEHLSPHPTIRATMTSEVEAVALDHAWEKTLRVYPLLGLVPRAVDEEVLFFEASGAVVPLRSRRHVSPGSDVTGGRGVSLTYWGATITLSVYQSLVDAYGLAEVFKTLLSLYVEACADVRPDPTHVMLEEGRIPEQYFVQSTMLSPSDYTPLPVTLYRSIGSIFCDERVGEDSDEGVTSAQVCIPYGPLDAYCKAQGITLEVLFLYALARSVYAIYPGERRDLSIAVPCDFRRTFSLPNTIAPCSRPMPLVITYEEVMERSTRDVVAAVAEKRNRQASRDYICSHLAMENTYGLLNLKRPCVNVNCVYDFNIGAAMSHLKGIELFDCSLRSAWLVRLKNELLVNLQFGRITESYADAIITVLQELGIDACLGIEPHKEFAESAHPIMESEE